MEWLTVSKAAERSRRIRRGACAAWRDTLTARSADSVEWPGLNPDWWVSSRLFCEKKEESWSEAAHSCDFDIKGRRYQTRFLGGAW